ncbi:MAG TPA: glycosyl hydrolase family 8 [Chitinispirillaceae bacterium]|nr:glycosyl hydrolase family 8 [Chitinispirillaceae bacterium]
MRFSSFLTALMLPVTLLATPKFPFPQNAEYPYGIKPATINHDNIQKAYDDFVARFYEESQDKSKARIKWDTPSLTVSEGIGYGMLIMVYMDNATNNTQEKFDKLWKYYNSYLNQNGLMHWKIDGFNNVVAQNAATDAELDVAVSLVQAHKQWGDQKYLDDAKALTEKIWTKEVNANGYLKPGDTWDSKKNPSYFSTAALESYKHASTRDWDKVITTSYTLLKKVANSTSGLVPDWCQENGGLTGENYYYDATRTPWRIAWGYAWYGHNDAKEFCSKIASWITQKTNGDATKIVDGYNLDGNAFKEAFNSAFAGSLACAGMVDATHQTWLNNAYKAQDSLTSVKESYFCTTLKIAYLLLLSGNMPDFWNPQVTSTIPGHKTQKSDYRSAPVVSFENSTISISISEPECVVVDLYSIDGKLISNLVNGHLQNGLHHTVISKALNNGTYILKLRTGSHNIASTLILNR